jgi:PEP-CTERM motif
MSIRTSTLSAVALFAAVCLSDGVSASPISFTGAAAAEARVEETGFDENDAVVAGGVIGSSLNSFGIDFSFGGSESYYSDIDPNSENSDSFFAFCGVSATGACDFQTGIDGRIVLEGTSFGGVTSYLQVDAGFLDEGSKLLLRVFGRDGALLSSASGVRGTSATDQPDYAPLLFTVLRDSADIAFFDFGLSEGDDYQGFGVNRISLETPTAVPVPGTLGLMGLGLVALGAIRRRNPG